MSIGGVNSLNTLHSAQKTSNKYMQQIASGSKINSASDDASSYAILKRMNSRIGSISQANQNTQNSNAMLATAAGGVESTINALGSLREKLINAANGTNGATDLAALQESVNQTIATVDKNVSDATYNGKTLLDGTQSLEVAGPDGMTTTMTLGDMSSTALGLTDNQGNSTIDLSSSSSISAAIEAVDSALEAATEQATSIGAAQQGLSYQSANYTVEEENLTAAASTMGDTDYAAAITKMREASTQEQLALQAMKLGMQHDREATLALLQ